MMGIALSDNEHGADKQSVMSIRYHQFQAPSLQNADLNTATSFDSKNMVSGLWLFFGRERLSDFSELAND